jgi:hypothetical protein
MQFGRDLKTLACRSSYATISALIISCRQSNFSHETGSTKTMRLRVNFGKLIFDFTSMTCPEYKKRQTKIQRQLIQPDLS